MNKSKSVPTKLVDQGVTPIKKSCSLSDISEKDYYNKEWLEYDDILYTKLANLIMDEYKNN